MLIHEASKAANLTKKAIEYYAEQGLIQPATLENGYRDFGRGDVETLKRVSILRRLGLGTRDIKAALADETGGTLKKLSVQKELGLQREQARKAILGRLCLGENESEVSAELDTLEQSATITEKLLDAFPGYYGRFICLHFARFLHAPIVTRQQQQAYEEIIAFLDNAPALVLPEDMQTFLDENTRDYSTENIISIIEATGKAIENPDGFFSENKDVLERYLEFRLSDEFTNSPFGKYQTLLMEFNNSSGYYDAFIPAMKRLSPSYAAYCDQLEVANEKLLSQYPEIQCKMESSPPSLKMK